MIRGLASTGLVTRFPDAPDHASIAEWCPRLDVDGLELSISRVWDAARVEHDLRAAGLRFQTAHLDKRIGAELIATILLGLIIIAVAPLFSPVVLTLFGTVIVAALLGTSWYLYVSQRILIDATYPLIGVACFPGFIGLAFILMSFVARDRK